MPGLDFFSNTAAATTTTTESTEAPLPGVYYNPRLDPKNYLEGPLSLNAATRLRQMLARPGIVVCDVPVNALSSAKYFLGRPWYLRRHQRPLRA